MSESVILIKSTQTRKYGKLEQTYSAEVTVVAENHEKIQAAYKYLNNVIAHEFQAFEGGYLASSIPQETSENERTWSGGWLALSITDGKKIYRLHTGEWTKYGVPVYPEVFEQFPPMEDDIFRVDLPNHGGTILMSDGKPKKVLSCRYVP